MNYKPKETTTNISWPYWLCIVWRRDQDSPKSAFVYEKKKVMNIEETFCVSFFLTYTKIVMLIALFSLPVPTGARRGDMIKFVVIDLNESLF